MRLNLTSSSDVRVSVVVPVYLGKIWIDRCLRAFADQTLSRDRFEIVLVFNGPDDGAGTIAEQFFKAEPDILHVLLESPASNAAIARNHGTEAANFEFVTWVDVDDTISAAFLELMLLAVKPGVVPFAQIVNVTPSGVVDPNNAIAGDFFAQSQPFVAPAAFSRALTFMTSKLVPTDWARRTPLDSSLTSGEDVAFYGELMSKFDFHLSLLPAAAGATYYRQLLTSSVSRGRSDYDFMVRQRADVIASLSRSLAQCKTPAAPVIRGFMSSQASFIRRYIEGNESERSEIFDYLTLRRIPQFPWHVLRKPVQDLVVAYNFAPYSDTGAVVASKRIRANGRPVDVISNTMASVRTSLVENSLLAEPYVARLAELDAPTTFASGRGIEAFVKRGVGQYENWSRNGRNYKSLYSRAMWPASHFLAARLKTLNRDLFWRAEFSDPVRVNNEGMIRESLIGVPEFERLYLGHATPETDAILLRSPDVYSWTENLPYAFADEIVFTNEHQKKIMLAYAPPELKSRIESVARVSPHPTLPRAFYELLDSKPLTEPGVVNIAYFGEFYSTRGLLEVRQALRSLASPDLEKIRLHIFTSSKRHELITEGDDVLVDVIVVHEKLAYFEFLSALDQFDCLIVNDAVTLDHHDINPYLPSKYSDYAGSTSQIWSLVEPGSILSSKPATFISAVGDVEGAAEVLRSLIVDPFRSFPA